MLRISAFGFVILAGLSLIQVSYSQTPFRIEIDGFALQYEADYPLEQNVLFDMRQPLLYGGRNLPETGGLVGPNGTQLGGAFDEATPAGQVRFYEDGVLVFELDHFFFVDFRQKLPDLPALGGTVAGTDHLFEFDLLFASQETLATGTGNDGWLSMQSTAGSPFDVTVSPHPAFGSLAPSILGSGQLLESSTVDSGFSEIPVLSHWEFADGQTLDLTYQTNSFVSNANIQGSELVAFDHAPDGRGSLGFSAEISGFLSVSSSPTEVPEPNTLAISLVASIGLLLRGRSLQG